MQLSWLLLGSAAALRPQVTRRSLCGAAPALVLAPPHSCRRPRGRRAERGAAPRGHLRGQRLDRGPETHDHRGRREGRGDGVAGAGGAGAFEVLHKEQYTAGFKPTNEKMSFNSEKFPTWASTATGSVAVDRSVEARRAAARARSSRAPVSKSRTLGGARSGPRNYLLRTAVGNPWPGLCGNRQFRHFPRHRRTPALGRTRLDRRAK